MTVTDKITSYKGKQVKENTKKWFDGEVLEKLNLRNKLFLRNSRNRDSILIKSYIKKSK